MSGVNSGADGVIGGVSSWADGVGMGVRSAGRPASGGALWTPSEISTSVWLDADDAATITDSGGAVSQWDDKSGGGFHFTQGTASKQPTTGSSTIGGKNAINFAGLLDWMGASAQPWGASVSDGFIIMLHKTSDPLVSGCEFNMGGTSTQSEQWTLNSAYGAGGNFHFDAGGWSGANRVTKTSNASAGETLITSGYCSTTDSVQEARKNGAVVASDATGHTVSFTGNATLFCRYADWVESNGDLAELIAIEGTVSTDTREKLEGYLAHKWGQAALLDAGHTYKSAAPTL